MCGAGALLGLTESHVGDEVTGHSRTGSGRGDVNVVSSLESVSHFAKRMIFLVNRLCETFHAGI